MSGTDFPDDWKSVLAVTDPGPAGDDVLAAAAGIASSLGAELHVLDGLGLIGAHLGEALPLLHGTYVQSRARLLEQQIERAIPDGRRPASITLEYQRADQALGARAEAVDADLIVVPAREPSPVGFAPPRETLTAAALRTGRPTLLARGELKWPPSVVASASLGGTDGAMPEAAARHRPGSPSGTPAGPTKRAPGGVPGVALAALRPTAATSSAAPTERAYARGPAVAQAASGWGADKVVLSPDPGPVDLVVVAAPPSAFERGGEGNRIVTTLACGILLLPLDPEGAVHTPRATPAAVLVSP